MRRGRPQRSPSLPSTDGGTGFSCWRGGGPPSGAQGSPRAPWRATHQWQDGGGKSRFSDVTSPFAFMVIWKKIGLNRLLSGPGAATLISPSCVSVASPFCRLVSNARLNSTDSRYVSSEVSPVPIALKTEWDVPVMTLSFTVDVVRKYTSPTI